MAFFFDARLRFLAAGGLGAVMAIGGCATATPELDFQSIAEPFPFQALAMTPIAATAAGYHTHVEGADEEGKGGTNIELDGLLDDYSAAGVQKRISFYKDFRKRLHETVQRETLAGDLWADYAVIDNHIESQLVELERIRGHEHDPNLYLKLLGTALYTPLVHEYAPASERYGHIIARLNKVSEFIEQAKQNLRSSPAAWTEVARQDNAGLIEFIQNVIPASLPGERKGDFDAASQAALDALRGFDGFLADLASDHDWRLGPELYAAKLRANLATDESPDRILARAEEELQAVMAETINVAEALDKEIYGSARPPSDKRRLMNGVLEVVQEDNRLRSPSGLMDEVTQGIDELKVFTKEANIIPAPPRDNLRIVQTPEFLRGLYPVTGFLAAPILAPKQDAFYWVTPIAEDLPRARLQAVLREYNQHTVKLWSARQAMPGQYAQAELTAEIPDSYRRVLRGVLGDRAYRDGWSAYIVQGMITAGLEQTDNSFKMVWQRMALGIVARAIVDIRMHTKNMSEEEAADFLSSEAYQGPETVAVTLSQVKLTSAELPAGYVGWKAWTKVRDHYQTETQDFSLSSFHDKALRAGPLPVRELGYVVSDGRRMAE